MTSEIDNSNSEQTQQIDVNYVVVGESEDGERMELPTSSENNSLGLSTLVHAFPGAHGLKYKTSTGSNRALLLDSTGTHFLPPSDGWKGKFFQVIYQNQISRSTGDQNAKRKKMMDESDDGSGGDEIQGVAKQKRLEEPVEKACTDLIVLGIPFKSTCETVRSYFEAFGEVVMFDLKTNPNGISKGFGFVRMKDYDSQLRILAQPVHEIDGRKCQVRIPLSKSEANPPHISRIFVGRVPERLTVDDLKSYFSSEVAKIDPDATVTDVFIPRPFRSFAFVDFSNGTVAKEIVRRGGCIINGASVAISAAVPREPEFPPKLGQRVYTHRGRTSSALPRKHVSLYEKFPREAQGMYYEGFEPPDNWRAGAYRGSDSRSVNRFSPGYGSTSRYASNVPSGSQALASGMDALNLDRMNVEPEVVDAAWQAFWNTVNCGSGGGVVHPSNAVNKW